MSAIKFAFVRGGIRLLGPVAKDPLAVGSLRLDPCDYYTPSTWLSSLSGSLSLAVSREPFVSRVGVPFDSAPFRTCAPWSPMLNLDVFGCASLRRTTPGGRPSRVIPDGCCGCGFCSRHSGLWVFHDRWGLEQCCCILLYWRRILVPCTLVPLPSECRFSFFSLFSAPNLSHASK